MIKSISNAALVGLLLLGPVAGAQEIIHDAEYAIIAAQAEAFFIGNTVIKQEILAGFIVGRIGDVFVTKVPA